MNHNLHFTSWPLCVSKPSFLYIHICAYIFMYIFVCLCFCICMHPCVYLTYITIYFLLYVMWFWLDILHIAKSVNVSRSVTSWWYSTEKVVRSIIENICKTHWTDPKSWEMSSFSTVLILCFSTFLTSVSSQLPRRRAADPSPTLGQSLESYWRLVQ